MQDPQTIYTQLTQWAEPAYRQFACSLLPGVEDVLGVRLPRLRALARQIARQPDVDVFLAQARDTSLEERMLHGMVIGALPVPLAEQLPAIAAFIPRIDNWSVCDSFCSSLKATRQDPSLMWTFLQPYLSDPAPYSRRFAVVMLLQYYIDAAHLDEVLSRLNDVPTTEPTVRLAVAWAVSVCFAKYPERTMAFLLDNQLDAPTYRKALQKILESRRVSAADKAAIRALRTQAAKG